MDVALGFQNPVPRSLTTRTYAMGGTNPRALQFANKSETADASRQFDTGALRRNCADVRIARRVSGVRAKIAKILRNDPGAPVPTAAWPGAGAATQSATKPSSRLPGDVWRAAAVVVPAIWFGNAGTLPSPSAAPEDVAAPEPRRPPPALEDALHATPPVPDASEGLNDALHHASRKEAP
jgi:hypothetical protein